MSGSSDRIIEALRRIVRPLLARIDYLALYPARIVTQAADGTLEVVPDDERLPGMTRVALRTFLPGVEVKVKDGGRVLVGFEGGDPSKPVATLFDGGALAELKITASTKIVVDAAEVDLVSAGGLPLARQGDMVASGGAMPAACTVTILDPAPAPAPVLTKTPMPALIQFTPIPLAGTIVSGNPTRKA